MAITSKEEKSEPRIKNIVRWVSKSGRSDDSKRVVAVEELNEYISKYMEQGYKLRDTHYLGDAPEGYGLLYVLTKDA